MRWVTADWQMCEPKNTDPARNPQDKNHSDAVHHLLMAKKETVPNLMKGD